MTCAVLMVITWDFSFFISWVLLTILQHRLNLRFGDFEAILHSSFCSIRHLCIVGPSRRQAIVNQWQRSVIWFPLILLHILIFGIYYNNLSRTFGVFTFFGLSSSWAGKPLTPNAGIFGLRFRWSIRSILSSPCKFCFSFFILHSRKFFLLFLVFLLESLMRFQKCWICLEQSTIAKDAVLLGGHHLLVDLIQVRMGLMLLFLRRIRSHIERWAPGHNVCFVFLTVSHRFGSVVPEVILLLVSLNEGDGLILIWFIRCCIVWLLLQLWFARFTCLNDWRWRWATTVSLRRVHIKRFTKRRWLPIWLLQWWISYFRPRRNWQRMYFAVLQIHAHCFLLL